MTDKILEALGASDELEALRKIAEANEFLAAVHEATGRETYTASLGVIKSAINMGREIATITEKDGDAGLGVVLAWKGSHEKFPALEAKTEELEEKVRKQDIAGLIAAGLETPRAGANPHAGKLTPATAKFWEARNPEELRAFLDVSPRVIPGELKPAPSNGPSAFTPNEAGRVANADGETYEQMAPAARAALKKSDPALYDAIRGDWEKAGKPAGKLASVA